MQGAVGAVGAARLGLGDLGEGGTGTMAVHHSALEHGNLKPYAVFGVLLIPPSFQTTASCFECFLRVHNCSVKLSSTSTPISGEVMEVK